VWHAVILSVLLFNTVLHTPASGSDGVAGSVHSGDSIGLTVEGRRDFIEGWNVDQPFDGGWYYGAPCQGPTYVAGATYILERIEFMAGFMAGTAVIELRGDDGSGCPTGPVLASGSFEQVETIEWQGADLVPPVDVEAGRTYHINYRVITDGVSSIALTGDLVPHCWAEDCVEWEGPETMFYWMAKFYGSHPPTPSQRSSWGKVKSIYRQP
jgi:hypothetical protein